MKNILAISRRARVRILLSLPAFLTTIVMLAVTITGCTKKDIGAQTTIEQTAVAHSDTAHSTEVSIERGKYLVTTGGCNDCHTPWKMGEKGPEPDMLRMLSGHPATVKVGPGPKLGPEYGMVVSNTNTAFFGPWGTSFAANLTPDSTGLGTWTEKDFITAIRSGQHKNGQRPIMPPMPWPWVSNLTDNDLKSVYAYLHSIPKVNNPVPAYAPPVAPTTAAKGGEKSAAKKG